MIIVHGTIDIEPIHIEEALRLSLEHVRRSRTEPGCISHAVHRDAEAPNRLVFFEEWMSMDALHTHFQVPDSNAFVSRLRNLASADPTMRIFDSAPVE